MMQIYALSNKKIQQIEQSELQEKKFDKVWIDIKSITKEESVLLQEACNIHPLIVEDFLHADSRIKVEEFSDYLFLVFYTFRKKETIQILELDFVLNSKFLITHHTEDIDKYEKIKNNSQKLALLLEKGTEYLFHQLIDNEVDAMQPILEAISDNIDTLEERILSSADQTNIASDILSMKREVSKMRRIMMAQREKFSFIAKNNLPFISKKALPYFRDVYDHIIVASDIIEDLKENINSAYEIYMTNLSNKMNEVMKILGIFATISLPLTVISGIFGTNFFNLPLAHNEYGFWVMILAMFLMSTSMIYFFKRRGWF